MTEDLRKVIVEGAEAWTLPPAELGRAVAIAVAARPRAEATTTEICKVVAQAICRDASRVEGCHCKGKDARCHAARLYAGRAAVVVQALRTRGFL